MLRHAHQREQEFRLVHQREQELLLARQRGIHHQHVLQAVILPNPDPVHREHPDIVAVEADTADLQVVVAGDTADPQAVADLAVVPEEAVEGGKLHRVLF